MRVATVAVLGWAATAAAQPAPSEATPAPVGRLVDLGGRRLHQICSGSGSPVVVIENGAGAFAVDWTRVQAEIAKSTRVCSYDRAGYAWSDPGPVQDGIEQTMDDLHLLLRQTTEPPYVMVGASLGAVYVRASQRRFPEQVAGIVFVDGSHDEAITFMSEGRRLPISRLSAEELRAAYAQYEKEAPKPGAGKADAETAGKLVKVEDAGQMIQLYRPDAVAAAIREVVAVTRASSRVSE